MHAGTYEVWSNHCCQMAHGDCGVSCGDGVACHAAVGSGHQCKRCPGSGGLKQNKRTESIVRHLLVQAYMKPNSCARFKIERGFQNEHIKLGHKVIQFKYQPQLHVLGVLFWVFGGGAIKLIHTKKCEKISKIFLDTALSFPKFEAYVIFKFLSFITFTFIYLIFI